MNITSLKSYKTGKTIFSGPYADIVACLEDAVQKRINLEYVDLSHQNLSNANLDEAHMPYADFTGCNLSGVNLSESNLRMSKFQHACLYNSYFCYSDLYGCDFINTDFGATNIVGADMQCCKFSTLSCFSLDFVDVGSLAGSQFHHVNGNIYPMSNSPIVIKGIFNTPIVIMDSVVQIGRNTFPRNDIPVTKLLGHIAAVPVDIKTVS
tara:strand:+ start:3001 stop:3624 length:624 start_codon:yes stop_codon:yes gene_type:complete